MNKNNNVLVAKRIRAKTVQLLFSRRDFFTSQDPRPLALHTRWIGRVRLVTLVILVRITLCDPVPGTTSPSDLSLRRHVTAIRVDVVPVANPQSEFTILNRAVAVLLPLSNSKAGAALVLYKTAVALPALKSRSVCLEIFCVRWHPVSEPSAVPPSLVAATTNTCKKSYPTKNLEHFSCSVDTPGSRSS